MPSVLLHSCCGPCATYTVDYWRRKKLEVVGFWFNPNIHPLEEHQRRYETLIQFSKAVELRLIASPGYEMEAYFQETSGHEQDRCQRCFLLRLSRTADMALQQGFDSFSTTLLISPYQKHSLLKEVGEAVAEARKIKFLYHDLRDGYRESRRMARELGLYMQKYCGCVHSEAEGQERLKTAARRKETG